MPNLLIINCWFFFPGVHIHPPGHRSPRMAPFSSCFPSLKRPNVLPRWMGCCIHSRLRCTCARMKNMQWGQLGKEVVKEKKKNGN